MNFNSRRFAVLSLGLGILSLVGYLAFTGSAHRAERRAQEAQFAVATSGGEATLVTLEVDGMTCEGCARSVVEELQKVEGVTAARVDLGRHVAEVRLAGPEVASADLLEAVQLAGYAARLEPVAAGR